MTQTPRRLQRVEARMTPRPATIADDGAKTPVRCVAVTQRIAANTRSATITTGGAKKDSEASDDCALGA